MGTTRMHRVRRTTAAIGAALGLSAALLVGTAGQATAQPTSTGMTCTSGNPLFWAPGFTWNIHAGSGESIRPGGDVLEPALLLSGDNDLPAPPSGLLPSIGLNWYGSRVIVDWHNTTTGESGQSISDEANWQQKPGIPINRTHTGVGTVDFTVTAQTGAGWWFLNTQNAVCTGKIAIVGA